ncbi:RimK/LysX family protein [Telluribacter sp. SYSU D00476]|uniref:ATP-dependent zinc protease family protein n=1 Tax=Telluribacter sp. SYSU D00476 TaxID=2811430 RepID=UPI001FF516EA|nr:RimK/LysX family protein [Telluribacter sp. SYSU D00476]
MKKKPKKSSQKSGKDVIGATEMVDFPELGWHHVQARVDTGAATSAIHCSRVRLVRQGEQVRLSFYLDVQKGAPKQRFSVSEFKEKTIKNSFGQEERRYVIKTKITLMGRKIRTEFSLADRQKMTYPVLLGRKLLKGRFVVDVSQKNLSSQTQKSRAFEEPDATASTIV